MNILFSDSSYKQHIIDLLHFYMEQDRKVQWGYKKPRGDLNSKEQAFGLAADMGGPGCVTPAMLCPRKSLITLATFVLEQSNSTFPLSRETKSCGCPEKPFPWALLSTTSFRVWIPWKNSTFWEIGRFPCKGFNAKGKKRKLLVIK